jgi:heat shock protein HtpX
VSDVRFAPDRALSVRMLSVMVLLAGLYAGALAVLVLTSGRAWPVAVGVVAAVAVFQLFTSRRVAMGALRAYEVTPGQEPELHAVVDRLCALAGAVKPAIAVSDSDVPNACAVGRSRKAATLIVTRGLIRRLEPTELEAVLAHELAHVEHGDAAVMTVAAFVGVVAGLIARVGARLVFFASRARGLWQFALVAMAFVALSTATWFVSLVLTRSLSRYREFAADRSAAQLTGNPSALASALTKVSQAVGGKGGIPVKDLRQASALNAFYFAPVVSARAAASDLLSTHPSTAARLERLARMTGRM